MLSSITTVVIADDAPVYDADNFPPQFDGHSASDASNGNTSHTNVSSAPKQSQTEEQRITRLEQQIENQAQSTSSSKLETMRTEIQSLRSQVEELTHQLQQVQNQQKSMYSDLDKRLTTTSSSKAVVAVDAAPKEASPPKKQPNVAEEQKIYETAYELIKVKKYDEAVTTLQKMLQKYPTGQFAANAHYWLGELYGLLNKNDQSANEFSAVVKNYPDSSKVADAELKLGLIYAAQFKWAEAKAAFKKVVILYPGTASARLASEQLKQLKQTQAAPGH